MEDYNKIIESLSVRHIKSRNIRIIKPLTLENFRDVDNTIILLHRGEISYGREKEKVSPGELLFIPSNTAVVLTYGSTKEAVKLSQETFLNNIDTYYEINKTISPVEVNGDNYSYVTFDARIFDSVNFFSSLDIKPFKISENNRISGIIFDLIREHLNKEAGMERVIKLNTERIVIEIIRYILNNRLFVEQLATNSTYFKDPRLLKIFAFIKENMSSDLSNKILANVAEVSEDYVGQYFKMLTGINPQDYIEYQRMEKAVTLLRTSKRSIKEIGEDVGFKDTAYFCRRFKMMFGIPAGKMRQRENLLND